MAVGVAIKVGGSTVSLDEVGIDKLALLEELIGIALDGKLSALMISAAYPTC